MFLFVFCFAPWIKVDRKVEWNVQAEDFTQTMLFYMHKHRFGVEVKFESYDVISKKTAQQR